METPQFAAMMGRPDRMARSLSVVGSPYTSPAAEVSLQGSGGVGLVQVGADFSGRLSAGMLGGIVIAFAAFYIWTRGFQA